MIAARRMLWLAVAGVAVLPLSLANAQGEGQPLTPERAQCLAKRKSRADQVAAKTTAVDGAAVKLPSKKEVDEIEADYVRYEKEWFAHQRRLVRILEHKRERERRAARRRNAAAIRAATDLERERHLEAIGQLEQFIERHPDSEKYTPDAMFRLAELYLDESEYQFDKRANEPFAARETNAIADYSRAIAMWRSIAERFPRYNRRADVLYLWAHFLKQTGEERRALQVARGLVCGNRYDPVAAPPPSPKNAANQRLLSHRTENGNAVLYDGCHAGTGHARLVDEAWVRLVGDSHFYTPGELGEAISAYRQVSDKRSSKYHGEALYKLAWSYYRDDDLAAAVREFDRSIKLSDELVASGKAPLELRSEALQYLALAFTDPWESEASIDPALAWTRIRDFYKGRLGESHIRDVFVQLGDTFKLLQAYPQAIEAWQVALARSPNHPENPRLHYKIVASHELMGDKDAADAEATRFASLYSDCSGWYLANQDDLDAMADQRTLGERMLRAAAESAHRAAQKARRDHDEAPSKVNESRFRARYREASTLYHQLISSYPGSDDEYELMYRLGETTHFSGDYLGAIPYYQWVRDHRQQSRSHLEHALRSIAQSYEQEIARRTTSGELKPPPIPSLARLKRQPTPIRALPMAELYDKLRQAYDDYVSMASQRETVAALSFQAALVSFRHLDVEDATRRFEKITRDYCGTAEAVKAKDALLTVYQAKGDSERFRATNREFIASRCGSADEIALAKAQNQARLFRDAEGWFRDKSYAKAALAFYRYYKHADATDKNLALSLYNAAVAYQRSGQPRTAAHLFGELITNPSPSFRESEYYVPALFLAAKANQQRFDYQNAVDNYLRTARAAAQKWRKPPPDGRSLDQIRLDSLYNAALLRELDRVYFDPENAPGTGADSLYRRYARLEPERRKKDRALWQIARMWQTANNAKLMGVAFEEWRTRFGRDAGNEDDYVRSYYAEAKALEARGQQLESQAMRERTVSAWNEIGRPKGTPAADMAAEFVFEKAERFFRSKFEPWKIDRAPRTEAQARQVVDALAAISDETKKRYDELVAFHSPFWSQAALVRIGDVRFFQALKLQQAPVPAELVRMDEKFPEKEILLRYEDAIAERVKPLTDSARQQWQRVSQASLKGGFSNRWTRLARERLHDFVSQDDYPVLREELVEGTLRP